jgi:hypothetical protein
MWFLKTDANGRMQWNQTYGGVEDDYGYVSTHTPDGGYAIVGSTMSYGAGSADFWLIKTDANGVMRWNQTLGGIGFDEGQFVYVNRSGVYTIVGITAALGTEDCNGWLIETNAFDQTPPAPAIEWSVLQQASIAGIIVLVLIGVVAVFLLVKKKN